MKRYYVSVTEHLNKVVSVDAESEKEAVQKVQDAYNTIVKSFSIATISAEKQ